MTSASMEMSASARSGKTTSNPEIDEALAILKDKQRAFAALGPSARADLLRACLPRLVDVAPRWVDAALAAKGLSASQPVASEEWIAGVMPTIRNVRLLIRSLEEIAARGKPQLPKGFGEAQDGRTIADVFPGEAIDGALFAGFRCTVRMLEGVSASEARERQAGFYSKSEREGAVSLVLGAGNVASIGAMDALYKMFVDGSVCVLKMNPVNEYLGPHYEEAFKPLVDAGYLKITYGAGDVGAYLAEHAAVDDIHITGSDRTHDLIVWGAGEEQKRRKATKDRKSKKHITSELGCVTPVIFVPGEFSAGELEFVAQNIATMVANNASCNCNAAKMLITSKGWPQRDALLWRVRNILASVPPRKAYYPGAFDRYEHLTSGRGDKAVKLGDAKEGELPWALCFDLDSNDESERLFSTEPFCPILSETALDENDPAAFLKKATAFANDRLWGTLSAVVMIHPKTEADPFVARALADCVRDLRYGGVGINQWSALIYATVNPPWGAHPSSTLENIQGGLGWVHNTYMLDGIEKAVLRGPLVAKPKPPWFVTHKNAHVVAKKLISFEASPSWLKVPGIALAALKG